MLKREKESHLIGMQEILKKKFSIASENDKTRIKNLHNALTNDERSVFYATNQIKKNFSKKAKTSIYEKDKVFVNIYYNLNNDLKKLEPLLEKPPLNTKFIEKKAIFIAQRCIVSMVHFNCYKHILLI